LRPPHNLEHHFDLMPMFCIKELVICHGLVSTRVNKVSAIATHFSLDDYTPVAGSQQLPAWRVKGDLETWVKDLL